MLSWNTQAPEGELSFRLLRAHQPDSDWVPHARWSQSGRHSYSAKHGDLVVETDVITTAQPFDGIEMRANGVRFDLLALATPVHNVPSAAQAGQRIELAVPARSQYVVERERGWCSPTSLSMLHAFHGVDLDVESTARAVFDSAYNGTGNWSFNVALSGALGLRGIVAYLRNLEHARAFIEAGLPVALSYSWKGDELPGAPVEHSDGHLVVLRGFDERGDCLINDPAAPDLQVTYAREAIEFIWLRNKGVAFVAAKPGTDFEALVNAA